MIILKMCKVTFSFTLKGKLSKGMWKKGKDNGKGWGGLKECLKIVVKLKVTVKLKFWCALSYPCRLGERSEVIKAWKIHF